MYLEKESFSLTVKNLAISSNDVMDIFNIKEGKQVDNILNHLFKLVIDEKINNNEDDLINEVKYIKESLIQGVENAIDNGCAVTEEDFELYKVLTKAV